MGVCAPGHIPVSVRALFKPRPLPRPPRPISDLNRRHVRCAPASLFPSLTISAPFRAITLPACSQLCLDLDDDEWENAVFEPAKEVLLRFVSTDDDIAQGASKVWTLLGMLADVAGPLGLRRVYVYTDVAVLSRQVRVGLCGKLGSF